MDREGRPATAAGGASSPIVGYWRPDDGIVWASYMHEGYVYTADRTRGVDVLRLTENATVARAARREVSAPVPSKRQLAFLDRASRQFTTDPGTAGICLINVR